MAIGPMEPTTGFQSLLGFLCGSFLLGRMEEDGGAVLLAEIRALAVHLSRIVHLPENVEQLLVADFGWIERDLDHLRMAGCVGANVPIRGILRVPAGIA